jgi:hypothetical protein
VHAYVQSQLRSVGKAVKPYHSVAGMKQAQAVYVSGAEKIMPLVMRLYENFAVEVIEAAVGETQWLAEELYDKNPWDEAGPNDPPLHSAEAWKIHTRIGKKGQLIVSVSNPKDYMQFLEAGWSHQAPAGWIAATYREFWLRVGRAIRRIR